MSTAEKLADVRWRKSSRSENGDCVEVAVLRDGQVAVRDSKTPDSPHLKFTPTTWKTFLTALRNNQLQRP